MDIRTKVCFSLSKKLMSSPAQRTVNYEAYGDWRDISLTNSFDVFSNSTVKGKYVLDFGCGDGHLSLFLAKEKKPVRVLGVDISEPAIKKANEWLNKSIIPEKVKIDFVLGSIDGLPVPDNTIDTILAFDCLEHIMSPAEILNEWHRVLRPEGRC